MRVPLVSVPSRMKTANKARCFHARHALQQPWHTRGLAAGITVGQQEPLPQTVEAGQGMRGGAGAQPPPVAGGAIPVALATEPEELVAVVATAGDGRITLPRASVTTAGLGWALMAMPLAKVAGLPLPATTRTVGATSRKTGETCAPRARLLSALPNPILTRIGLDRVWGERGAAAGRGAPPAPPHGSGRCWCRSG